MTPTPTPTRPRAASLLPRTDAPAPTYCVVVGGPGRKPIAIAAASGLDWHEAMFRAARWNGLHPEMLLSASVQADEVDAGDLLSGEG